MLTQDQLLRYGSRKDTSGSAWPQQRSVGAHYSMMTSYSILDVVEGKRACRGEGETRRVEVEGELIMSLIGRAFWSCPPM
jgi:hypothetical protein